MPELPEPGSDRDAVRELEEALNAARRVLRPAELDAWQACVVFGETTTEAALRLGRSRAAVKMALSRATRRLREMFADPAAGAADNSG